MNLTTYLADNSANNGRAGLEYSAHPLYCGSWRQEQERKVRLSSEFSCFRYICLTREAAGCGKEFSDYYAFVSHLYQEPDRSHDFTSLKLLGKRKIKVSDFRASCSLCKGTLSRNNLAELKRHIQTNWHQKLVSKQTNVTNEVGVNTSESPVQKQAYGDYQLPTHLEMLFEGDFNAQDENLLPHLSPTASISVEETTLSSPGRMAVGQQSPAVYDRKAQKPGQCVEAPVTDLIFTGFFLSGGQQNNCPFFSDDEHQIWAQVHPEDVFGGVRLLE